MFKIIGENDRRKCINKLWDILPPTENVRGLNSPDVLSRIPGEYYSTSTVGKCDVYQRNAASLSSLIDSVFPPGVVGAELRVAADASLLSADEAQYLGCAVPKRIQEFAGGRHCARLAMAELGFYDYPLRVNSDRRPQWPQDIIGSISHTTGMCGAAVAKKSQFRAIGLDIEIVGDVTPEIWSHICTPGETAWLATLRPPEQGRCAALIFSAKESFYKCQYNLTQQWLEFCDVKLDISFNDSGTGCFALWPQRRIALLEHATAPLTGRFKFHDSLVVTGVVIEVR